MESAQSAAGVATEAVIQTDRSDSWGCGAFCCSKWLQWKWPSWLEGVSAHSFQLLSLGATFEVQGGIVPVWQHQCCSEGILKNNSWKLLEIASIRSRPRLYISNPQRAVQFYFRQGLAPSTHLAEQKRYVQLCDSVSKLVFPSLEDSLLAT